MENVMADKISKDDTAVVDIVANLDYATIEDRVMSLDVLTVQKPSEETVEEVANFYKRKAAEAYGCPIEEVTPEMRRAAKLALWRLYYTPDMPRGTK